ncbi:MAG: hypothetical protein V4438_02230 [Patescibacteria group bacterium]
MSDIEIDVEKKPNIFVRVAVIAGMLIILFLIAAGIVKYVPKIISAISPANVSLTSLFNSGTNGSTATTTESVPAEANPNPAYNAAPQPEATTSTPVYQSAPARTPAPAPRPAPAYVYTYPRYTGPSDLAVSLVKVGQIDNNGSFIQTNSIQPGSRVQIVFNVSNVGSGASQSWNLNAVLPTSISGERVYNSQAEPSIPPGASYQMTLAFDAYDPSTSAIQITLQGGADVNTGNNILIVPLTSNGYNNYNNNYNNGCYYQNGYQYCSNNNSGNNTNYSNNCYWSNNYYYCNGNGNGSVSNADLSVTITNVGTMDRNTGQFYYTNSIYRGDKAAVQFEVRNNGSTNSGSFTWTANFPSNSNSTFTSSTQNSLAPGQTMTFTAGFDNLYVGSQNVTVQLYPSGSDSNSSNNYASRSVYVN